MEMATVLENTNWTLNIHFILCYANGQVGQQLEFVRKIPTDYIVSQNCD